MSTTPITNIYHPDNATPAQDVTALGAMADSIETAMLNLPRKFANFTALEAWTPTNGAIAFVQADGRIYQREGSVWRPILGRHVTSNTAGRTYFGADDTGIGSSYVALSPEGDTGSSMFWVSYDGAISFRLFRSGNAQFHGNVTFDGDILTQNLPVRRAEGTTSVTATASSGGSVSATFPSGRFTSAPRIMLTKQSGGAAKYIPYVTGVTATGFTLGIFSGDGMASTQTAIVGWVATQENL